MLVVLLVIVIFFGIFRNFLNLMNINLNMDFVGILDRIVLKRNLKDIVWDYGILEFEECG